MLVSLIINLVYSFQEAVRFLHVGSLSYVLESRHEDMRAQMVFHAVTQRKAPCRSRDLQGAFLCLWSGKRYHSLYSGCSA